MLDGVEGDAAAIAAVGCLDRLDRATVRARNRLRQVEPAHLNPRLAMWIRLSLHASC